MGPEWVAFLFTVLAVLAVLGTAWLGLRERERELRRRERSAEAWNESLDSRWRSIRDREYRLMHAPGGSR